MFIKLERAKHMFRSTPKENDNFKFSQSIGVAFLTVSPMTSHLYLIYFLFFVERKNFLN